MEKYLRVLELMKLKGGHIDIDDPDLKSVLGDSKFTGKDLTYRVSVYVSYIRRFAKLEVKTIRTGRKAIAYELVRANEESADQQEPIWRSSKYLKPSADDLPQPSTE